MIEKVQVGDMLSLQREDNKFDSNAVMILNAEGKKMGYVPEKDNIIFARLMDAGKLLKAKVSDVMMKGSFKQISIGIYQVDFSEVFIMNNMDNKWSISKKADNKMFT